MALVPIGQLDVPPELPRDVAGLHDFCSPEETGWIGTEGKVVWSEGEAIVNFGQYKGKSLKEICGIDSELWPAWEQACQA